MPGGYDEIASSLNQASHRYIFISILVMIFAFIFLCYLIFRKSRNFKYLSISVVFFSYLISMFIRLASGAVTGTGVGAFFVALVICLYIYRSKKIGAYFGVNNFDKTAERLDPTL